MVMAIDLAKQGYLSRKEILMDGSPWRQGLGDVLQDSRSRFRHSAKQKAKFPFRPFSSSDVARRDIGEA
jgi:hypothetical protein